VRVTFILSDVRFRTRIGGYRVHYELANRLAERGHQVVVLHRTDRWQVWLGRKLWPILGRLRGRAFIPWFDLSPSVRLVVRRRVDHRTVPRSDVLVFSHWRTVVDLPAIRTSATTLVYVWDYEFWTEGDDATRDEMRAALAQPGLVLVAGSVAVEQMLEAMGLQATVTIPPGIDLDTFRVIEPVDRRSLTVGYLNRSHPSKGMADLGQALTAVRRDCGDAEVVASGAAEGIPDWIERRPAGTDDALAAFYNQLAVFVLPSHSEGLGLPGLEAMASGCALVVTDNGGSRQYARDGANAIVVPPRDSEALAQAIVRLLRDGEEREAIARAGAATAATFTWPRATDAFESLLRAETASRS
jgi:glycosyltransferase involved in cell wall biosynthesis